MDGEKAPRSLTDRGAIFFDRQSRTLVAANVESQRGTLLTGMVILVMQSKEYVIGPDIRSFGVDRELASCLTTGSNIPEPTIVGKELYSGLVSAFQDSSNSDVLRRPFGVIVAKSHVESCKICLFNLLFVNKFG